MISTMFLRSLLLLIQLILLPMVENYAVQSRSVSFFSRLLDAGTNTRPCNNHRRTDTESVCTAPRYEEYLPWADGVSDNPFRSCICSPRRGYKFPTTTMMTNVSKKNDVHRCCCPSIAVHLVGCSRNLFHHEP